MLYLSWQLDPVLLGGLLALAWSYGLAVGPLRSRLAPGAPFPRVRAAVFYGGLALLYLVEGSPLHDLAERYLFVAHMGQHILVSYLVAPILLAGVPAWLLRPLLLNRLVRPIARVALHPLVTFAAFTVFFDAWHIPAFYEGALRNTSLHHFEHFLFLLTSVMVWWPLMSPLEELPRPSYLVQLVYLFLLPVAQIPVFGAITFADGPLYPSYANAPVRAFGLTVLNDQALGGIVMKVAGLFAFGAPFIAIFFRWYRTEMAQPERRPAAPAEGALPTDPPARRSPAP